MAKPWKEVIAMPEFQALSAREQDEAQEQYFNEVVAPHVPEQDLSLVKEQFYKQYPKRMVDTFMGEMPRPTKDMLDFDKETFDELLNVVPIGGASKVIPKGLDALEPAFQKVFMPIVEKVGAKTLNHRNMLTKGIPAGVKEGVKETAKEANKWTTGDVFSALKKGDLFDDPVSKAKAGVTWLVPGGPVIAGAASGVKGISKGVKAAKKATRKGMHDEIMSEEEATGTLKPYWHKLMDYLKKQRTTHANPGVNDEIAAEINVKNQTDEEFRKKARGDDEEE